jgi:mono/diheme cytochrome c family protein
MLAWGDLGLLTERQIEELVAMIRAWEPNAPETAGPAAVESAQAAKGDPDSGAILFAQFCSGCHGLNGETEVGDRFILRIAAGSRDDSTLARQIRDGSQGMPSFHALLTTSNISDLLALMQTWQAGPIPTPTAVSLSGAELFLRVCSRCHGQNGEGGIGQPLNSKRFLTSNDDAAIRQWIERGTLGTSMLSWGDLGLLTNAQIDELVAFIRSWEPTAPETDADPTMALPPSAEAGEAIHGQQLFANFCSGCHGFEGERPTRGFILNSEDFMSGVNDEIIASQIQNGGRQMPSFHAILTSQDLNDLLAFMRSGFSVGGLTASAPSFSADVLPIFAEHCTLCHGAAGNWSAEDYQAVMTSGDHAPVIIAGDAENSLLVQKLQNTQTIGDQMPIAQLLSDEQVQLIVDWIAAGAADD